METPIFGINIPAPKVKIKHELLEKYVDLYNGIRNKEDTVTWRTLITTTRTLLGIKSPDFEKVKPRNYLKAKKLIRQLTAGTYFSELVPEIEYAVGLKVSTKKAYGNIDILILSGRHYPEPMLWNLADYAKSLGKKVAVVNPVGHYNDDQTRVVGPVRFFHKIKKLVILSSTQSKLGGNVSVLANVIRLLRNPELTKQIGKVEVVIPMFGGSRGHKPGQGEEVGYEVMEASFNAKVLSLLTKNILERLKDEVKTLPKVQFSSLDIHSFEYPGKTFSEEGFEFKSISPSEILARGILNLIKSKKLKLPLKLIACDKGAIPRTQNLARELLNLDGGHIESLEIVYIEKKRLTAGVIETAEVAALEEWKMHKNEISTKKLKVPVKADFKKTIIVYSDDMIDTGGTAERDLSFISGYFPNSILKIFVATHSIFSKGFSTIKRIGADAYILGNTLSWDGLSDTKSVDVVDLSEAIYKFIFQDQ